MSLATEQEDSGSIPPEVSDPLLETLVGQTPTVSAVFNGVTVPCIVDTGSMVSFVTEAFYREKLQPACGDMLETTILTIRGVNGLEVPYIGYLKLDVTIGGGNRPRSGSINPKGDQGHCRRTPTHSWVTGD